MYRGQESWDSNSLRFATKIEAEKAGRELLFRWIVPVNSRAAQSEDAVNYVFDDTIGRPVPISGWHSINLIHYSNHENLHSKG